MSDQAHPCRTCLRRSWLVARLAGRIDVAWLARRPLPALLALPDAALLEALAPDGARDRLAREYAEFDAEAALTHVAASGVSALCRCDPGYPSALGDLPDPPAVLYVYRDVARLRTLLDGASVAIVGARRATPYGLEQARTLGRGLAAAGVTVVSGMALGADSSAHAGALEESGTTLAVLAGGPERPYPASKRALHARIAAHGAVVAEMPPGAGVWRWCFPARNRLIAALSQVTLVIEAGERSGSLITAALAADLGREIAAVPGQVTTPLAAGTNALIADGAKLVRDARDVLELLFDAAEIELRAAPPPAHPPLEPELGTLFGRIASGRETVAALTADGIPLDAVLAGLAELELRGLVRRAAGGRYLSTVGSGR